MNTLNTYFFIAEIIFFAGLIGFLVNIRLPAPATALVKRVFEFQCLLMGLLIVLAFFDIYLRGYWTGKVLIWLFVFTASVLFAFGDREIMTRPWKIFTGLIFYFPIANFMIYWTIPFLVPLLAFSIWFHVAGDPKSILYNDHEIRIQNASSLENFKQWPRVFIKKGPLEFDKGEISVNYYFNPDSIQVKKNSGTITVLLYKKSFEPVAFYFKK